jgi:hypothetical protein
MYGGRDRGADSMVDGPGADRGWLGPGRDSVELQEGPDIVSTGAGRDAVVVSPDGSPDTIRCGPGSDKVLFLDSRDAGDVVRDCERVVVTPSD